MPPMTSGSEPVSRERRLFMSPLRAQRDRTHTGLGLAPKIALVTVLITLAGLAAVTALGYAFITATSRKEIGAQLEGRAFTVAQVIDARVAGALANLEALTRSEEIRAALRQGSGGARASGQA